ncbi:MAG TPA: sigma factor, partial [Terriglobia bacterium]|nr:sigma factor [Terriglobia bacterium]
MQLRPIRTRSGTAPFDAMNLPNFSDPQFIQQLKSRDRAAIERLVDAYLHQLLRAARGMGFLPDESEDLAQAAFLAFIESAERFEGRSHVRTFLFGIFYNKVSEHLRHKQRARQ